MVREMSIRVSHVSNFIIGRLIRACEGPESQSISWPDGVKGDLKQALISLTFSFTYVYRLACVKHSHAGIVFTQ